MFKNKYVFLQIIIIILFSILVIALYNMQIIKGEDYKNIAEKNYVRVKKQKSLRGQIFDQKYRPVVKNKASVNLYVTPSKIKSREELCKFVSSFLEISYDEIYKLLYDNRFLSYNDVLLFQNVPRDKVFQMSEHLYKYPSLFFGTSTVREYAFPNHFTGYVSSISDKEYEALKDKGYSPDDEIGKNGLEKQYEEILRGQPGYQVLQVDAKGKSLGFFKHNIEREAINGDDIILNLDIELQKVAEEAFPKGMKGAAIVVDVRTGGILTYVSLPNFDPNIFMQSIPQTVWDSLYTSLDYPLLDRCISGAYPPGSTFKALVGSLGLESGVITPATRLEFCAGGMKIGNRFFKCWSPAGHGSLVLRDAMKYSCDTFFYDLSLRFSLDVMRQYIINSYVIDKTGVDLPGERAGLFPDREWYTKHYGKGFSEIGQKVNLTIGQGEVLTTPLQICSYFAALANNGIWITPHFLDKTLGQPNKRYEEINKLEKKALPLSSANLTVIQDALKAVINEPGGTGGGARVPGVTVYGKTGSAENHMGKLTHAWFAGYAAWEEPEIAMVVFLESAGHGGSIAAPIAQKIISYYDQAVRNPQ